MAMVILLSLFELEGQDTRLSRRYDMITSTALYLGMEEDDHGHGPLLLRTTRLDPLLSRRYAMTTLTALYLLRRGRR